MEAVGVYVQLTIFLLPLYLHCSQGQDCGHRPRVRRVIGGQEAISHSWPWIAEIQYNLAGNWHHKCGASLIHPQWIVTAAHCLTPRRHWPIRIVLGEHDRSKEEGTEQYFNASQCCIHQSFQLETSYGFDIAIVRLSNAANLTRAVGLVCLPEQNHRVVVGQMCYLAGWGVDKRGGDRASKLQEVQLPTVNQSTCSQGNSFFKPIDNESMLCAGFGGNSTATGCNGDSGGPLVCKESGKFVLRGAVSWGIPGCPAGETFSVFARVSSFVDWIDDRIKSGDNCTCIDDGMRFTAKPNRATKAWSSFKTTMGLLFLLNCVVACLNYSL